MKEKKLKIRKVFKNNIFGFILVAIIFGVIGVGATTLLYSKDVTYDNSSSGMSATTVQDALDELNEKATNAPECDSDGNCTGGCPSGEGIVEVTSTGYKCEKLPVKDNAITTGTGLHVDSTESGRFYYTGSDPNNKIVFNGEPYKILAIEPDGRIKIIKMISVGTQRWAVSGTEATNWWSQSNIKSYLNNTWLPTQASGEDYQYLSTSNAWYVGKVSPDYAYNNISSAYSSEKSSSVNSVVGLISVSEYLKSKSSGSTFLAYSNYWWTISANSNYSNHVFSVFNGSIESASYGGGYQIFPVLYLKSTVLLIGSGTSSEPYCISGSSCPTNLNFTQRAS